MENDLKPGFCCLGVTDKCMLRCRMCHKWQEDIFTKGAKAEDFPTLDQYKNFISGLREIVDDNFVINFGGGEALLMEGVLELVDYSVKLGFWTNIASNGWLIDEDMAGRIAGSGLNEINISLDSLNETTHDALRGVKGVHRRVMNAIDYIHKKNSSIKVGICSVINDINLGEIIPLVEWVNNNSKLNGIYFTAVMQPNNTPFDKDWRKGEFNFLWPKDPEVVSALIDRIISLKTAGYRIGNTVMQLEAFKRYFQFPDRFVKVNKCNLQRAINVSALGDIFLCFRWGRLDNIMNGSDIKRIWHSPQAAKIRQHISDCRDNCHFLINCFFEGDYPFVLN